MLLAQIEKIGLPLNLADSNKYYPVGDGGKRLTRVDMDAKNSGTRIDAIIQAIANANANGATGAGDVDMILAPDSDDNKNVILVNYCDSTNNQHQLFLMEVHEWNDLQIGVDDKLVVRKIPKSVLKKAFEGQGFESKEDFGRGLKGIFVPGFLVPDALALLEHNRKNVWQHWAVALGLSLGVADGLWMLSYFIVGDSGAATAMNFVYPFVLAALAGALYANRLKARYREEQGALPDAINKNPNEIIIPPHINEAFNKQGMQLAFKVLCAVFAFIYGEMWIDGLELGSEYSEYLESLYTGLIVAGAVVLAAGAQDYKDHGRFTANASFYLALGLAVTAAVTAWCLIAAGTPGIVEGMLNNADYDFDFLKWANTGTETTEGIVEGVLTYVAAPAATGAAVLMSFSSIPVADKALAKTVEAASGLATKARQKLGGCFSYS